MSNLKKNDYTNDSPLTTREKVETILMLGAIGVGSILAITFISKLIGLVIPIIVIAVVGYFAYPKVVNFIKNKN